MLTADSWLHVVIYLASLVAAVVGHAFFMGRKFEAVTGRMDVMQATINGKFDKQAAEDEYCKNERVQLRNDLGTLFGRTEDHGQRLAVLTGEAKTWRKGDAHG